MFRLVERPDVIAELEMRGMHKTPPSNNEIDEVIRMLGKIVNFREHSEYSGNPKRVNYMLMKEFYRDFECSVSMDYFIELFPMVDEMYIDWIISNREDIKKRNLEK